MIFPTKKDEEAFQEALTRAIFPISSNITDIQTVKQDRKCETDDDCGNHADFKITRTGTRKGEAEYNQYICINCIEDQMQDWQETMLENLKQQLERYKTAEQL